MSLERDTEYDLFATNEPDVLSPLLHVCLAEHYGGQCPHVRGQRPVCEDVAQRLQPHLLHGLIPALLRAWSDKWDVEEGVETWESHLIRHIADELQAGPEEPEPDYGPRTEDHQLPPL